MSIIRRKMLRERADKQREEAALAEVERVRGLKEALEAKIKEWEREQEKIKPVRAEESQFVLDPDQGVKFDLAETSELTTEKPKRARRK